MKILSRYFKQEAFAPNADRLKAYKILINTDLNKAGIAHKPLIGGSFPGDIHVDPLNYTEDELTNALKRQGWFITGRHGSHILYKNHPRYGKFLIQIKRWISDKGRYKTFTEQSDEELRESDDLLKVAQQKAEVEVFKKNVIRYTQEYYDLIDKFHNELKNLVNNDIRKRKYAFDKDMSNNNLMKTLPSDGLHYNYIKYTNKEPFLGILELSMRNEMQSYTKETQKLFDDTRLDKIKLAMPNRGLD